MRDILALSLAIARSFMYLIWVDFAFWNRCGCGKDTSIHPWPLKQIVTAIFKLSNKSALKVRVLRDFNSSSPFHGRRVADQGKQEQSAVVSEGGKSLIPMKGVGWLESWTDALQRVQPLKTLTHSFMSGRARGSASFCIWVEVMSSESITSSRVPWQCRLWNWKASLWTNTVKDRDQDQKRATKLLILEKSG
jgi:hypothetical protein